jgi:two-component system cell cycle response regulator
MARILVIEDNAANLELMTYLLKAFGHSVLTAGDGSGGLEAARRESPELIICDIQLPGMDGYEVARQLKIEPALKCIPLIAVTALAMVGDRDRGLAAGFDAYISKPIEPEQFIAQIENFLRVEQRGEAPLQPPAPLVDTTHPLNPTRATILVVDDSPTNRELIRDTLAPSGYDVRLAASVAAGIADAREIIPDLILSDLHMPGADGFDFIRQVKADPRLALIPFVFISSSVWGEGDRELALQLGVTRFLLRPIEPQTLLDELAACLAADQGWNHGEHSDR